jgi:SpoIID/LytB domain protein
MLLWNMGLKNSLHKSAKLLMVLAFCISTIPAVYARSLNDITSELNQKQAELKKLQENLKQAESDLKTKKEAAAKSTDAVGKIQSQIDEIDATLKYNQLQMDELGKAKKLKELEKEQFEQMQDLQVNSAYLSWKSGDTTASLFGGANPVKHTIYNEAVYTKSYGGILGLATELSEIEGQVADYKKSSEETQAQMAELDKKKQEAMQQLAAANAEVNKASGSVKQIQAQKSQVQSSISFLSKEEQEVLRKQQEIYEETGNNTPPPKTEELHAGEFYFEGRGSNFVTGHGIGMSQWGAYGAAINRGWNYKQIVEFYYPGAKVMKLSNLPANMNVNGYGVMPLEKYVAGIGEVTDIACENIGKPANASGCWPKEAILAQVVVSRTFGARRSGGIATSDSAQVYKGGEAKKWAAEATAGEVVVWNGALADVYFSADNNEGYGNADKETVWGGSRIPYLTNVNDNAFAAKPYFSACKMWCGSWKWRSYTYNSDSIKVFFNWAYNNGYPTSFGGLRNIGTISSVSLSKDASQRVNKVTFKGQNGTYSVTGKTFRDAWNLWNRTKPADKRDLMYSFTYSVFSK